ncbi:MAG: ABC transporter permease [Mitsuokella sp.]
MFWQMVKGALIRQRKRFFLIALTVALGVSLAAAMLNVMFDIGAKVNQELKAYGANITVTPRTASVLQDVYGVESGHKEYLQEKDISKIKTIFWTNNIVAFAPDLAGTLTLTDGKEVPLHGTWFEHVVTLPTGESITTGAQEIKSWWTVAGAWPREGAGEALVGEKLAADLGVSAGDTLHYRGKDGEEGTLKVSGIVTGGGAEDESITTDLGFVQGIVGAEGKVDKIEVSAITTPENDLARKAAANPERLSQKEREIWYCTAYVSSIAFQIEEAIPGSAAQPVRQIAESEGKILEKTEMLMMLITGLSLISAALGVSNLVSANIMERSREFGLMKALGATNLSVSLMVLAEIFIAGIGGGIVGYFGGLLLAQAIGQTVFGSAIAINLFVAPIVAALMALMLLVGSLPAIRMLLSLQPASVLHGR